MILILFASFDLCVYYYPVLFPETEYSDYIDFSLKFPASEYRFIIYDIFNYLDIEDFNLYYYNRCYAKISVDSAVDNIFAVCQKYMADIDYIAKRNDAIAKLEKQCDADEYLDIKMPGLFPEQLIKALFAGLLFFIAFLFSLGGKIVSLFAPDEDKEGFSLKFIGKDTGTRSRKTMKKIGIILTVVLVTFGVLIMFLPISFF